MEHPASEIIKQIETKLKACYPNKTLRNQYAWWMLQEITQKTKTELLTQDALVLNDAEKEKLNDWINQQVEKKVPLQYLIGWVPFGDLTIFVEPPVLIPRPETEEWTLRIVDQLKKLQNKKLNILDLCTGSGCVGLALAHALPEAHIVATDISAYALALAKKNALHNNIENSTFIESNVFESIPSHNQFDLIVSNPPYISEKEYEQLDESVRGWEDPQALRADDEGFAIIRVIVDQAKAYLKENKELAQQRINQLFIEVGYNQGPETVVLMSAASYTNINVDQDMYKKDRLVSGSIQNVASTETEK